jgi:hypothetical protein
VGIYVSPCFVKRALTSARTLSCVEYLLRPTDVRKHMFRHDFVPRYGFLGLTNYVQLSLTHTTDCSHDQKISSTFVYRISSSLDQQSGSVYLKESTLFPRWESVLPYGKIVSLLLVLNMGKINKWNSE